METTMLNDMHSSEFIYEEELDIADEPKTEGSEEFFLCRRSFLNDWFTKTVLQYKSGKTVPRESLTDKEYEFIMSNSVVSATDICYSLLEKHVEDNFESNLDRVLSVIRFLEDRRLPKEYLGGFMILMTKYHFLPA